MFFRKLTNTLGGAGSWFRKDVADPVGNLFRKGGIAEQAVDNASVGLRKVGNTLSQVHTQAGKVLNSDVANSLAHLAGANGLAALNAARGTNSAIGLAFNLAGQGSQMANRGNYSGSSGNVVNNILERSKNIAQTGAQGRQIQFA